ncbi:MAG: hypothetical protein WBA74_15040, partial [Cyclobacteriaceae bacterium]
GQLVQNSTGRIEETTCVDYITLDCTRVTVNGEEFSDHCVVSGVVTVCTSTNSPPGIAPDYPGPGSGPAPKGKDASTDNLCPHPTIQGLYLDCDTCFDGYEKDADGNCVKHNPAKLCAGSITFMANAKGFVAQVMGLGANAVHNDSKISFNVEFGITCITMYSLNGNTLGAAHNFANAYNLARDQLDDWLQLRDPEFLTTTEVQIKLTQLINSSLGRFGYYIKSRCNGDNVPVSIARYDLNC